MAIGKSVQMSKTAYTDKTEIRFATLTDFGKVNEEVIDEILSKDESFHLEVLDDDCVLISINDYRTRIFIMKNKGGMKITFSDDKYGDLGFGADEGPFRGLIEKVIKG